MAIFIDGHVHIYKEFDRERFFSAAFENFTQASERENASQGATYVLALAEGGDNDVFSDLCRHAEPFETYPYKQNNSGALHFFKTAESDSLLVWNGKDTIVLLAGRQHISKEKIEVLSLCDTTEIEDKTFPLPELAKRIANSGGIVVLPWGVGKWFGARGEMVKEFLGVAHEYTFFLGDNGNRPSFWPTPSLFSLAHKKNIQLLSGSDPLPLGSHYNQVATFGTLLIDGIISDSCPAESIRNLLKQRCNVKEFGSRVRCRRFFYDQLYINFINRFL